MRLKLPHWNQISLCKVFLSFHLLKNSRFHFISKYHEIISNDLHERHCTMAFLQKPTRKIVLKEIKRKIVRRANLLHRSQE
jgi:hypothetical protein